MIDAGAQAMGHYALESCRIEKGFRHWGHDIGPDTLLPETGLPVKIDWSKTFNGKQALQTLQDKRTMNKLVLLQLQGQPLVLHDEPVRDGNTVLGLTTSGCQGVRTGQSLAFAYLELEPGETLSEASQRQLNVEIAGNHYPAQVLEKPPYDPAGLKMRS